MNRKYFTIEAARSHAESFIEEITAKATTGIADRIRTRLSFPPPLNSIDEGEIQQIVIEEIRKEIYGA